MKLKFIVILLVMFVQYLLLSQVKAEVRAGVLVHKSRVFDKPNLKSQIVKTLNVNEAIDIHRRQRAWYHISSDDELFGWVKMLDVRFSGVIKRESETGVANLVSSVTGGSNLPTVSTGVRGFDEEDLKKAKANIKQIELLNSYIIKKEQLRDFIYKGRLVVNHITVKESSVKENTALDDENKQGVIK